MSQPSQNDIGKKCYGMYLGTVLQHLTHGMLKVHIQGIYPEEWAQSPEKLPICHQITPQFGGSHDGNGVFSYPNIGATVACMFANGDQNLPIMVGSILGGMNAFGQYEWIRTNEELSSSKHLVTAGKSHVEMYEDGKISAIVFDPIRTEANVSYGQTPDASLSIDAVESRPICDKVAANELSNINCQFVLDNHANHGTLSSGTHYFDTGDSKQTISSDGKVQTIRKSGTISTDSYNIVDNNGKLAFGQLCSMNASIFANIVDPSSGSTINDSNATTADISVHFTNGIDGMQSTKALCSVSSAQSYNSVGNDGSITRNTTTKQTAESFSGHGVDTSFGQYGTLDGTIVETMNNSTTGQNKSLNWKRHTYTGVTSPSGSKVEIDVLSSGQLTENDSAAGIDSHTNKHNASALATFDTENGISLESMFDDNDMKSSGGTTIQERSQNRTDALFLTSHEPTISMSSKRKYTQTVNGATQKKDVDCLLEASPTKEKVEISIKDNIKQGNCSITMDSEGNIVIKSSKSLLIDVPDVTCKGISMKQLYTTITELASMMTLTGSNGDCKIKNVSLLYHKHQETQAGDVVWPQPTKTATQSN